MQEIRCSSPKCNKVVGKLEFGKAEFKCKHCGTYTEVEIKQEPTQVGPEQDIQQAPRARAYVGQIRG